MIVRCCVAQGSVPEGHEYLVWSNCSLLPDWANPLKLQRADVNIDYKEENKCVARTSFVLNRDHEFFEFVGICCLLDWTKLLSVVGTWFSVLACLMSVSCPVSRLSKLEEYVAEIARQLNIQTDPAAQSVIGHVANICKDVKKAGSNDEVKAYLKVSVSWAALRRRLTGSFDTIVMQLLSHLSHPCTHSEVLVFV